MNTDFIGSDVNQVEPSSLSHIIGQKQVIDLLRIQLRAYFNVRSATGNGDQSFGPVALAGPSGTGKTLIAKAIHAELGNLRLYHTNGEATNTQCELYAILLRADEHTTVFIDEAHGMNSKAQQILLTALSERKLFVPSRTSSDHSCTIPLDSFTMIFATTDEHMLQDPLLNRMRICCRLQYYSVQDLVEIVRQRADALLRHGIR